MGYQEFFIKTSESKLETDFDKIRNILLDKQIYGSVLNIIAVLKKEINYKNQTFYPNDLFICVTGDRHSLEYILHNETLYPIDNLLHSAAIQNQCSSYKDYQSIFEDVPISEYLDYQLDPELD